MSPATLASIPTYQEKLKTLCDLYVNEEQARILWYQIVAHHKKMQVCLGRSVDLVVSALDFLKTNMSKFQDIIIVDKQNYEEVWRGAYRDPLTGLYNRRYLVENLKRELEKSKRYHLSFSLVFIDLDYFKSVNDQFGHMIGDLVLQRTAKLIQRMSREADLSARFGGEEFVILMPQTTDRMAWKAVERLRKVYEQQGRRIQDPVFSGLTLSGGVVSCPRDAQNLGDILHLADQALYAAKRDGRNRIYQYAELKKDQRGGSLFGKARGDFYEKAS